MFEFSVRACTTFIIVSQDVLFKYTIFKNTYKYIIFYIYVLTLNTKVENGICKTKKNNTVIPSFFGKSIYVYLSKKYIVEHLMALNSYH